jgi:transcriptional regulator with GAF, ATPase, and Fis domain
VELKFTYGLPEKLIGKWLSHDHGIIGRVARTGQAEVCHDHSHWSGREAIFDACNFETMVGVPLKRDGRVKGILFVAYSADQNPFIETDLEILERFAYHAVIAWHFCQLMSPEQRRLRLLPILHKISDYIQSAGDSDKIIHAVLTGVTAGYGSGFNRAALFLLDEREENLTGHLGIGHLIETNALARTGNA